VTTVSEKDPNVNQIVNHFAALLFIRAHHALTFPVGATTCLTELVVLACILTRDPLSEFIHQYGSKFVDFVSKGEIGRADIGSCISYIQGDPKISVLLRCFATVIVYQIWVHSVKPSKKSEQASKIDTDSNGANGEDSSRCNTMPPEMVKAQKVVSSSTTAFNEKYKASMTYIDALAKPVGSLGTLEEWASRLCALQNTITPRADPVGAIIFAADHGVAASHENGGEGCSL
jgi:hypothetical protein